LRLLVNYSDENLLIDFSLQNLRFTPIFPVEMIEPRLLSGVRRRNREAISSPYPQNHDAIVTSWGATERSAN